MDTKPFQDKRVLLVEDETMIAMLMEDMLVELGCIIVGISSEIESARQKVNSADFDVAILDVNLNGVTTYSLAEELSRRGVPFLFATGYGANSLPPEYEGVPRLEKPFQQKTLEETLLLALSSDGCQRDGATDARTQIPKY